MKKTGIIALATLILSIIYSCEPAKTVVDYYNSAVGRSNMSSTFFLRMNQVIRDRELGEFTNYNLVGGLKTPIEHIAYEIEQLKALLGNEGSNSLIQAAIDSAQYEYDLAVSNELKAVYKVIDDSPNVEKLQQSLAPHAEYLDNIMTKHDMLFEKLNLEITKYAKENNIEENIINIP